MKIYLVICLLLLLACNSMAQNAHMSAKHAKEEIAFRLKGKRSKYKLPVKPIIADEETAVKVAEAILFKIFGEEEIKSEKPYTVGFADGYWVIHGYLPPMTFGGVFEIIINSNNGEVVHLSHPK